MDVNSDRASGVLATAWNNPPVVERTDSLVWARAGVVAALTFLLGAVGHVSGGGLLPSGLVLAAVLVIGTPLCAVVLARPASTRRIVTLVVAGQTACHVLLSLSAGHRGDSVDAPPLHGPSPVAVVEGPRVGTLHDHYEATIGAPPSAQALSVPDPIAVLDHLPMFLAHTAVAVLVGLWLAAGEQALWAVLTMVFAALVARCVVPRAVFLVARPRSVLRRRPASLPSLGRASRCVVRRGPPALLAV